jgi:RimJ/RimL family protein N-acetyltransferase
MIDVSAFNVVPHVKTERLLLRELRLDDFETYARFMSDPQATGSVPAIPDRRTAWRTFASSTGSWLITGAGWWAIELTQTGEFIGFVGAFFRETMLPLRADSDFELGWVLFPPYWRRGFAREAAAAALRSGFERHGAQRALAQMDPANTPSVAVARAIGMTLAGNMDFYGSANVVYAVTRGDAARV